jgi:hypothetical protein
MKNVEYLLGYNMSIDTLSLDFPLIIPSRKKMTKFKNQVSTPPPPPASFASTQKSSFYVKMLLGGQASAKPLNNISHIIQP